MTHAIGSRAAAVFVAGVCGFGAYVATTGTADARRGFRASFSSGVSSGVRAVARPARSVEEVSRLKQAESRIDWSEVGRKGLEVVKTVLEQAAGSTGSGSGSSPAFAASTLNPVELEACVRESKWLDDKSDEYDAKKARLDQQSAEIDRLGQEIEGARGRVNRSSQRSVDAFNARIGEHRRQVSYYNDVLLPDLRRTQDEINSRVGKFNSWCNGKSYHAADLADVESKVGFKLN